MDRKLIRQKVCQKISVIKTNTCDDITKIVHFGILIHILFSLLRFSDEPFEDP